MTPDELITQLRSVLLTTRQLVGVASSSGFTDEDDLRRLFVNNGALTKALAMIDQHQK